MRRASRFPYNIPYKQDVSCPSNCQITAVVSWCHGLVLFWSLWDCSSFTMSYVWWPQFCGFFCCWYGIDSDADADSFCTCGFSNSLSALFSFIERITFTLVQLLVCARVCVCFSLPSCFSQKFSYNDCLPLYPHICDTNAKMRQTKKWVKNTAACVIAYNGCM